MHGSSFFSKTRSPHLSAAIYVGSHTIKGAIFEVPKSADEPPKIHKKFAYSVPYESNGHEREIRKLKELIFLMAKSAGKIPDRIVVSLDPSYGTHKVIAKTLRPEHAKIFSHRELEDAVHSLCTAEEEEKPLCYPLEFFVNGYSFLHLGESTSSHTGTEIAMRPAKVTEAVAEVTVEAYIIDASSQFRTLFRELKQSLGGMPIEFIPAGVAVQFSVCREFSIAQALLVDVGGEQTSCVLVEDSEFKNFASCGIGFRSFVQAAAQAFSSTPENAESAMRNAVQGLAADTRLKEVLEKQGALWEKSFFEMLDELYHLGPLPAQVYLYGEGAYLPVIQEKLRTSEWIKNYSNAASSYVRVMSGESLFGGHSLDGLTRGPEEADLAASLYYALHHEKNH